MNAASGVKKTGNLPMIRTIKDRCRVCFTCVRECPAKAIRMADGQAEVIGERCIGCGNCVRVCSQKAKQMYDSIPEVEALLAGGGRVAACVAPSFPAEFSDLAFDQLVGMIRALGFDLVAEVAFGADLVAREYGELLRKNDSKRYISTSCPAVFGYVKRYHPQLIDSLAPVVSPMIATARALRHFYGKDLNIVFIGPCIAKKGEAATDEVQGEIDAVLTFSELRQMVNSAGITSDNVTPADFDPPHGGQGALFPVSRGALQAAALPEDLTSGDIVAADGRSNFIEAIKEFESGDLDARFLDVLCCNGCIMGAGISSSAPLFRRRSRVSKYVRERLSHWDRASWERAMDLCADLDMSRTFHPFDQRMAGPSGPQIDAILARMGKRRRDDELNCGACGYDTCREHAIAIYKGLAESEMCLPYTIDQLRVSVNELAVSHDQLAKTQQALMQSEKLASMGQLAAGIAHEVNNPLGVVLMYAHLLLDQVTPEHDIHGDLKMIAEQADRCKKIVAGLLNFARQNKVIRQPADVRELVEHCLRLITVPAAIKVNIEHRVKAPVAELDADQMTQVLNNLIVNAVDAMAGGGSLTLITNGDDAQVRFIVQDTGCGIQRDNLRKIFTPFFTTKQIGKGTGLGLAVSYGIVKMHCGDIRVESNADPAAGPTGTTFTVTIPRLGPGE